MPRGSSRPRCHFSMTSSRRPRVPDIIRFRSAIKPTHITFLSHLPQKKSHRAIPARSRMERGNAHNPYGVSSSNSSRMVCRPPLAPRQMTFALEKTSRKVSPTASLGWLSASSSATLSKSMILLDWCPQEHSRSSMVAHLSLASPVPP